MLEVCLCTLMKVIVEHSAHWDVYLGKLTSSVYANVHNDILSFLILFNYVVPISLYVTIGIHYSCNICIIYTIVPKFNCVFPRASKVYGIILLQLGFENVRQII